VRYRRSDATPGRSPKSPEIPPMSAPARHGLRLRGYAADLPTPPDAGSKHRSIRRRRAVQAENQAENQTEIRAGFPTDGKVGSQDWRAGRIQEWLLLLLRFAITHDPTDESAASAMADEIDAIGLRWRPSAPSFFRRTSAEVCKAIIARDDPRRTAILNSHIARIDDVRLRRAFQAAVEREQSSPPVPCETRRRNLWAGLRA
jgi:hypothetical protein